MSKFNVIIAETNESKQFKNLSDVATSLKIEYSIIRRIYRFQNNLDTHVIKNKLTKDLLNKIKIEPLNNIIDLQFN